MAELMEQAIEKDASAMDESDYLGIEESEYEASDEILVTCNGQAW